MEASELEFVKATRALGINRAAQIIAILSVYDGNSTKAAKVIKKTVSVDQKLSEEEANLLDKDLQSTLDQGDSHLPILSSAIKKTKTKKEMLIEFIGNNSGKFSVQEIAHHLANTTKIGTIDSWRNQLYLYCSSKHRYHLFRNENGKVYSL